MVNSKVIDMSDVFNGGGMAARIAQAKEKRRRLSGKVSNPVRRMWMSGISFQTKSWTGF